MMTFSYKNYVNILSVDALFIQNHSLKFYQFENA